MQAAWPGDRADRATNLSDAEAESQMAVLIAVITGIRNIRGEMNLAPALQLNVSVQTDDAAVRGTIEAHQDLILNLARLASIRVTPVGEKPSAAATAIIDKATLFVDLEGVIDFAKEKARLQKEIDKVEAELIPIAKKLANDNFLNKAPADVVAGVRTKHAGLTDKRDQLTSHLKKLSELGN
jgi:valyl-tRNA synthetase